MAVGIAVGAGEAGLAFAAEEITAKYRGGDRLVKMERCDYVRPTIVHCGSPDVAM